MQIDKRENNIQHVRTHLKDNPCITWIREQDTMERALNGHSIQWGRILKIGQRCDKTGKHWKPNQERFDYKNGLHIPSIWSNEWPQEPTRRTRRTRAPSHAGRWRHRKRERSRPLSDVLAKILATLGPITEMKQPAPCAYQRKRCAMHWITSISK